MLVAVHTLCNAVSGEGVGGSSMPGNRAKHRGITDCGKGSKCLQNGVTQFMNGPLSFIDRVPYFSFGPYRVPIVQGSVFLIRVSKNNDLKPVFNGQPLFS